MENKKTKLTISGVAKKSIKNISKKTVAEKMKSVEDAKKTPDKKKK